MKWFAVILLSLLTACAHAAGNSPARMTFDTATDFTPQSDPLYLGQLLSEAQQLGLADDPVWRALLHYKPRLMGGSLSQVDGEDFFLSRIGKQDPHAELAATLTAFFSEQRLAPRQETAQCRFRARYHWLKQQLIFDAQRLAEQACADFDLFADFLNAESLTVVFPAAHPNGPSSMFGHTLVRLDRPGQTPATRMLDYSLNFAAEADSARAMNYAITGLTGGFEGRYRMLPYYMKLREYAQMENRDIWEYRLSLKPETVHMLVRHVWELLPTYYDYYFFTENCAYHLLSALEPGMVDTPLTEDFSLWVLPVDTLRLLRKHDLVQDVDYYPSRHRLIQARRATLDQGAQSLAKTLAHEGLPKHAASLAGYDLATQAVILDLAFDYMRYLRSEAQDSLEAALDEHERGVLLARSRLGVSSTPPPVQRPPHAPDEGHPATRLSLGYGVAGDEAYWRLEARAVYHDWLDPSAGYSGNFALEFGQLALRHYPQGRHAIKLEQFNAVRIDNLEPRDDYFSSISWRLRVGADDLRQDPDQASLAFVTRGGGGASTRTRDQRWLLFALLEGDLNVGNDLQDRWRLAAGPVIGLLGDPLPGWRVYLEGEYFHDLSHDSAAPARLTLAQSWSPRRDLAWELSVQRQRDLDGWYNDAQLSLRWYFGAP